MPANPVLFEAESEKLTTTNGHHLALVVVHLQLQALFHVSGDARHDLFTSTLGLHQNDKVVGVAGELMPSSLQLLVQKIQDDVGQQR